MDIEDRLRKLEMRYRAASSAALAARAHYEALAGECGSTSCAIERARAQWHRLDTRRRGIAARMGEVEEIERDLTA